MGGEERHGEFERIMTVLGRDYAQSNLSNYRKGGLIGLAAAALGLADEAHRWLHLLLPLKIASPTARQETTTPLSPGAMERCAATST